MHSTGGRYQCAVHVDFSLGKELRRLLGPDFLPHLVKHVQQRAHVACVEAAAEVAGRGRVGNAPRPQGVEEHFVVAPQFDVLQAGTVAQRVVGQVEHVVALVIRQVNLQQVQAAVDRLSQTELADQEHDRAQAAVAHAARPLGHLEADVAAGQHRPRTITQLPLVEPPLDPPLGGTQSTLYLGLHSKSLLGEWVDGLDQSSNPANHRRISSFLRPPRANALGVRLVKD